MNLNKALYEMREIRDFRDMMNQSAEIFANEPAFKLKNKSGEYYDVSYAEFRQKIDALGAAITEREWRGKQIAIMGLNSYPWITTYLAVQIGGGCVVPIDKELYFDEKMIGTNLVHALIGALIVVVCSLSLKVIICSVFVRIAVIIPVCVLAYASFLIGIKNELFGSVVKWLFNRIKYGEMFLVGIEGYR